MVGNEKAAPRAPGKEPSDQDRPGLDADRRRRQNELLDEGLIETFPASDPVSVARVK